MLKISFLDNSDQQFIERLRRKPDQIRAVILTRLNAILFMLQSYIVTQKLSGQVLRRITGILAGSIRVIPAENQGFKIAGAIEGGGGPAFYAAYHEYGTSGPYEIFAVKGRALKFVSGGKEIFRSKVTHPGLAARPFMSTALEENEDQIAMELVEAVEQELAK